MRTGAATLAVLAILACGADGKPADNDAGVDAGPPIDAGADSPVAAIAVPGTVDVLSEITLDGRGSTSPASPITDYVWVLVSSPAESRAEIRDASLALGRFTPDRAGEYRIRLIVIARNGLNGRAEATFTANDACCKPVANAGGPRTVGRTDTITLDGSRSRDPRNLMLSYRWRLLDLPDGGAATLTPLDGPMPMFRPDPARPHATYRAHLVVSNGPLESAPDVAELSVANAPPTVTLTGDRIVRPGQSVTLSATAMDDDGDTLTYAWRVVSPPGAMGALFVGSVPSIVQLATLPGVLADYLVECTVSDAFGGQVSAQHTVSAANAAPTVELTSVAPVGHTCTASGACAATAQLTARATDPDGDRLDLQWSLDSGPAPAAFSSDTSAQTTVTFSSPLGTVAGTYVLRFCAKDALNAPQCATTQLVVSNAAPTVTAAASKTALQHVGPLSASPAPTPCNEYASELLELTAVGRDPELSPTETAGYLRYTWQVVERADSLAEVPPVDGTSLTGNPLRVRICKRCAASGACTPTPGLLGNYKFRVTARDPSGATGTSEVSVTVGNRAPLPSTMGGVKAGDATSGNHAYMAPEYLVAATPMGQRVGADADADPLTYQWCLGDPGASGPCNTLINGVSIADTAATIPTAVRLRGGTAIVGTHQVCVLSIDPWGERASDCIPLTVSNRAPSAPTALGLGSTPLASHSHSAGTYTASFSAAANGLATPPDPDGDPIVSGRWYIPYTVNPLDSSDRAPTVTGPVPGGSGVITVVGARRIVDTHSLCFALRDPFGAEGAPFCQNVTLTNSAPTVVTGVAHANRSLTCGPRPAGLSGCALCGGVSASSTTLQSTVTDPNGDRVTLTYTCTSTAGSCGTLPSAQVCTAPPCTFANAVACHPDPSTGQSACTFMGTVTDTFGEVATATAPHTVTCQGACTTCP